MTVESMRSEDEQELLLVVERLSTQDRHRIVRLVELLSRAPDDVRAESQRKLRRLLAADSVSVSGGLEQIDGILAGIESELRGREAQRKRPVFLRALRSRIATGG